MTVILIIFGALSKNMEKRICELDNRVLLNSAGILRRVLVNREDLDFSEVHQLLLG